MATISGPIALYANIPIHPEYYQPRRFVISAISLGKTTTVTTSEDHDYVIGQNVRIRIPVLYGAQQLNAAYGMVISIPSTTQVEINIDSSFANAFIPNPLTATITNISQTNPVVITANNSFKTGNFVTISSVVGMTELNNQTFQAVQVTATTITININGILFTPYVSDGTLTLVTFDNSVPQIMAVGDNNSGPTNLYGRIQQQTYIDGSFINISPG